ncbi:MAG: WecB/TagA/CpsF family glycosyltransferase [Patescibacteria group bacterium]
MSGLLAAETEDVKHTVLGVSFVDLTPESLRFKLSQWLGGPIPKIIVTPNPEFIMTARRDPEFKHLLAKADLSLPDGVGLRFAVAALTDQRLQHRHTGADTLLLLAELAAQKDKSLVILGGSPRKSGRAAANLRERFPGLEVSTFDPGIIDEHQVCLSEMTLSSIERMAPAIIAVALGQGKQERVMQILRTKIPSARILIGIGGAADYVSNATKRAPESWQRFGFEWLWRLIQEPWRWRRIFAATVAFPLYVAWTALISGRIFKAVRQVSSELNHHFKRT